jgi:hypothetical protein
MECEGLRWFMGESRGKRGDKSEETGDMRKGENQWMR